MFQKLLLFLTAAVIAATLPLSAQTPPAAPETEEGEGNTPGNERFWQASLPGGDYMVSLARIASISRHTYLLDSTLVVDEVTVDSLGQALARFYFIEPLSTNSPSNTAAKVTARAQEDIGKVAERTAPGAQDMVVKKYPETTHARTIEFRLLSKEELTKLYKSVQTSWESGKGRKFKLE